MLPGAASGQLMAAVSSSRCCVDSCVRWGGVTSVCAGDESAVSVGGVSMCPSRTQSGASSRGSLNPSTTSAGGGVVGAGALVAWGSLLSCLTDAWRAGVRVS